MADGDAQRYAQIASLAAMMVALFCLIAWLLRLSILVRLISESGTSDGGRDVQAG
jgi:sulfate permease, SulP family